MAFESGQEPNVAALDHFAFAFSPISTRRRMASGREGGGFCFAIQASTSANGAGASVQ
jgi:hypothetical protein